jgi:hypothetical protein
MSGLMIRLSQLALPVFISRHDGQRGVDSATEADLQLLGRLLAGFITEMPAIIRSGALSSSNRSTKSPSRFVI